MLKAYLKIGDSGQKTDMEDYGFIYLDSDKRLGADSKGFESTAYPEEEGEHIIPKTVDAAFDYTAKFFIQPSDGTLGTANAKIAAFNATLHGEPDANGLKEYYQVAFYNDTKRHKIVGYPKEIPEATDFWADPKNQLNDIVLVEWTIRVTKPSLCNFSAAE